MLTSDASDLISLLSQVCTDGPIPALTQGDDSVSSTLMSALGIWPETKFRGIPVHASRRTGVGKSNRVNLFAQVPDWKLSSCKSSAEIVERYGYDMPDGARKLYCTVRSGNPNNQGLYLEVDKYRSLVVEKVISGGVVTEVATWSGELLKRRLCDRFPGHVWVNAISSRVDSTEYFHYRYAYYFEAPKQELLLDLISEGTVTLDHLILKPSGLHAHEKGPTFKINPANLSMLFPDPMLYDLMSIH